MIKELPQRTKKGENRKQRGKRKGFQRQGKDAAEHRPTRSGQTSSHPRHGRTPAVERADFGAQREAQLRLELIDAVRQRFEALDGRGRGKLSADETLQLANERIQATAKELSPNSPREAIRRARGVYEEIRGNLQVLEGLRDGNLETSVRKLERYNELVTQLGEVTQRQSELPHSGSVYSLRQELTAARSRRVEVVEEVTAAYRKPEAAARRIRKSLEREGSEETFRRLRDRPQSFGRLEGWKLVGKETPAHAAARETAERLGGEGLEAHERVVTGKKVLGTAERLLGESASIEREMARIAPGQAHLVAEIGHRAKGVSLETLKKRGLSPGGVAIVEEIRKAEAQHLKPLQQATKQFRKGIAVGSEKGFLARARVASGRFLKAPTHIRLRLSPLQLSAAYTAITAVRGLMRTVDLARDQ